MFNLIQLSLIQMNMTRHPENVAYREDLLGRYMYVFQPHAESSLVRDWMADSRLKDVLGSIIGAHLLNWLV